MAYNKIRGSQLQPKIIEAKHLADNFLLPEGSVSIDWAAHSDEILAKKLVVDFVQVNGKAVEAAATNLIVTGDISAPVANDSTTKGAVVQDGKNKVILRDAVTGDPLISPDGTEVYGKLTNDGTDYKVSFFAKDSTGTEQAFTFADAATIDFQFPQRFDFLSVAENFASNEKFVDGASDVSARLDLRQIALDVFGSGYAYDQDGSGNRAKTLIQELSEATHGVTNTAVKAGDVIDELVDARGTHATVKERFATNETNISAQTQALQDIKADLASVVTGKGASLVGVEDAGGVFTATTVEGVLAEIEGRLATVENTGGEEVIAARSSMAKSTDGTNPKEFASLDARFEELEEDVKADTKALVDYKTANDARVEAIEDDAADLETRITGLEGKNHGHFAEDKQILAGDPLIGSSTYNMQTGTFVAGDKSLSVYVNGMLQMVGVHYVENTDANGNGISVSFAPMLLEEQDVIQFRWSK